MTIAEYSRLVLDSHRQKVPEDGTPTQFHARVAMANCEVPISPKDCFYDNLKGDAVITFNPATLDSAVKYLVNKKAERIAALDRIRCGTPAETHDPIDLSSIRQHARFATSQEAWDALRKEGFAVADVSVWFESLRFWFAKTKDLEAWIERVQLINTEKFHAARRAAEAAV